jgi:glucokinase
VSHLYGPSDVEHLPGGPKVCIGAGTGLGECYLTQESDEGNYTCFPSEGGHVEFAPRDDLEIAMYRYLSHKFESRHRISVERVVSGIGLANVFEFLCSHLPDRVDAGKKAEFDQAGDQKGRVVATDITPGSLCDEAMKIMMSAYGCEAGSAAIKWIPTGGLFLSGGLTPKNIQYISGLESEFMKSYLHKGRVSHLLERIPLFAVMTEDLGVRGVHKAAQMEFERYTHNRIPYVDVDANSSERKNIKTLAMSLFQENSMLVATTLLVVIGVGYATTRQRQI